MTNSPFLVIPTVAQFAVLAILVIAFSVGLAGAITEIARRIWDWRSDRAIRRFMRNGR